MRQLGPHTAPISIILGMIGLSYVWNASVGLTFAIPVWKLMVIPAMFFLIAAFYLWRRPQKKDIIELMLYSGLWIVFPLFGTKLTFLALTLNFPMQDHFFDRIDAALGFHWIEWWRFIGRHYWFYVIQNAAYMSYAWQPFLTVPLLIFTAPPGRNRELLMAILAALAVTITIFAVVPTAGPMVLNGVGATLSELLDAIRSRSSTPLPYSGIICFPSFHTVMAILFTWAHRGLRWSFWPFALLNAVMLVAIPYCGNHYLSDMIGGAFVAYVAILAANTYSRSHIPPRLALQSQVDVRI